MSLRPLRQLSETLSSVEDPEDLGQLVGQICSCLDSVIQQTVSVYRRLTDKTSKTTFLKRFRKGLLMSNVAKSYVDKIMTTVNQCCIEGLTFHFVDPSENRKAQKPKAKRAAEADKSDGDGGDVGDDEGDKTDDAAEAMQVRLKRPRPPPKSKPKSAKRPVVVVTETVEVDEDDSAPRAIGFSPSFRSPESLLALKNARSAAVTLVFIDNLFEMFSSGNIPWNNGNNICVSLLLHIGECHDKVLQANHRQPCGSVAQVFREAIPHWTAYERQKGWIHSAKSRHKQDFEAAITSHPRWAITAPEVKGAVGLVLYALLAYFPGLCFTNISHHDENTSVEVKNNRAMAMLPSHHSVAMFSLLEQSGYITKGGYPKEFWETSAVCLSSNDSALDVCRVQKSVQEHRFRVWSEMEEDCLHFEDPPPIWGLDANTTWVKISSAMWGEIGPRRYLLLPLPPPLQKQRIFLTPL